MSGGDSDNGQIVEGIGKGDQVEEQIDQNFAYILDEDERWEKRFQAQVKDKQRREEED